MRTLLYKAIPWRKEEVTLALESGVDGIICPDSEKAVTASLSRSLVLGESEVAFIRLTGKADEERAVSLTKEITRSGTGLELEAGAGGKAKGPKEAAASANTPRLTVLESGWEIIPLENILADSQGAGVEVGSLEEARLAAGVLERGADVLIITPRAVEEIKEIVAAVKYAFSDIQLETAEITRITPVGMGHRVCVDTMSLLKTGQGMLVGNSVAFTFLVNAETERNEYVAARPFRINAGGVHAYVVLPDDRTAYLEEIASGREVLIVGSDGACSAATVGRVKIERRPMLLVEAKIQGNGKGGKAEAVSGAIFLQNAETIRLVRPSGEPVSVVELKTGDKVLCHVDVPGRHFGMRITEDIKEG